MTRSQCKVSDTQVTVKACGPLVGFIYLTYTYNVLGCMYCPFLPVNGLNFAKIGMSRASCTRLLAMSRATFYEECRPRKDFIYVGLYCAVQDSTRFYPFAGLFCYLQGLA